MQIVYNSLTEKEASNNYTCNICESIIKVSNGEMFTGYLGDRYFKCPVCGKYTVAEEPDKYQEAKDVVYPYSFHNYISDYKPVPCTDATINELIQDVFKDDFDAVKMNTAEFGDTMVLAVEDGVGNDGTTIYRLYICKNSDVTLCTKG